MQNGTAIDKTAGQFLLKLNIRVQYSSHALWYVPKGVENYVNIKGLFIAVLFVIAKT